MTIADWLVLVAGVTYGALLVYVAARWAMDLASSVEEGEHSMRTYVAAIAGVILVLTVFTTWAQFTRPASTVRAWVLVPTFLAGTAAALRLTYVVERHRRRAQLARQGRVERRRRRGRRC